VPPGFPAVLAALAIFAGLAAAEEIHVYNRVD
jgi:hypothetical protein